MKFNLKSIDKDTIEKILKYYSNTLVNDYMLPIISLNGNAINFSTTTKIAIPIKKDTIFIFFSY